MINLLPIENKQAAWRDYRLKKSIAIVMAVMFLLVSAILLIGSFYLSSLFGWNNIGQVAADAQEKNRPAYEQARQDLTNNLKLLSGVGPTGSPAAQFETLAATKIAGIKIQSLQYDAANNARLIKMLIVATTRKTAADYIIIVRAAPGVKNVNYPILIDDRDLLVPLEIILENKI